MFNFRVYLLVLSSFLLGLMVTRLIHSVSQSRHVTAKYFCADVVFVALVNMRVPLSFGE